MAAPPPRVFDVLVTDTGRASFWAESAVRSGDQIDWRFPGGETFRGQILPENQRGRAGRPGFGAARPQSEGGPRRRRPQSPPGPGVGQELLTYLIYSPECRAT